MRSTVRKVKWIGDDGREHVYYHFNSLIEKRRRQSKDYRRRFRRRFKLPLVANGTLSTMPSEAGHEVGAEQEKISGRLLF